MDNQKELAEKALNSVEEKKSPTVYKGIQIKAGKIMSSFERINFPAPGWQAREFSNVSKLDTKGYIPLDVQIKRYLLAGVRLQAYRNQFTSEDYIDAYKDIPTITEDMDFTEIKEIVDEINLRLSERQRIKAEESKLSTVDTSAGAQDAQRGAPTSEESAVRQVAEQMPEVADGGVQNSIKNSAKE